MPAFDTINLGFNQVFQTNRLTLGIGIPIENNGSSAIATMDEHLKRVQLVEELGFKAIWLRDIPFMVPSFGDAGQIFDPFTYLGFLAAQTTDIALGVASIALPLHYPVHVAKSAATVDQLSGGRLILGVASGDRRDEYPAMNISYDERGELFRESFAYLRKAAESFPILSTKHYGNLTGGIDVLPKPTSSKIPLMVTGSSQQSLEWNAIHSDGWISYPRSIDEQTRLIKDWRKLITLNQPGGKPFLQSMYVDLHSNDDFAPQPIPLGLRLGANYLVDYLQQLQAIGVNHVAIVLRFNAEPIHETLRRISESVVPHFH